MALFLCCSVESCIYPSLLVSLSSYDAGIDSFLMNVTALYSAAVLLLNDHCLLQIVLYIAGCAEPARIICESQNNDKGIEFWRLFHLEHNNNLQISHEAAAVLRL